MFALTMVGDGLPLANAGQMESMTTFKVLDFT
jgi:hypothetical protein